MIPIYGVVMIAVVVVVGVLLICVFCSPDARKAPPRPALFAVGGFTRARWTVGQMQAALATLPPHYDLLFNPGTCDDLTVYATISVLEGTTRDGVGSVWIKLLEDAQ